jgi:hypothetical protein
MARTSSRVFPRSRQNCAVTKVIILTEVLTEMSNQKQRNNQKLSSTEQKSGCLLPSR